MTRHPAVSDRPRLRCACGNITRAKSGACATCKPRKPAAKPQRKCLTCDTITIRKSQICANCASDRPANADDPNDPAYALPPGHWIVRNGVRRFIPDPIAPKPPPIAPTCTQCGKEVAAGDRTGRPRKTCSEECRRARIAERQRENRQRKAQTNQAA